MPFTWKKKLVQRRQSPHIDRIPSHSEGRLIIYDYRHGHRKKPENYRHGHREIDIYARFYLLKVFRLT